MVEYSKNLRRNSDSSPASGAKSTQDTSDPYLISNGLEACANQDPTEVIHEASFEERFPPRVEDLQVESLATVDEELELVGTATGAIDTQSMRIGGGGPSRFPPNWSDYGGEAGDRKVEPVSPVSPTGKPKSYTQNRERQQPQSPWEQPEDDYEASEPQNKTPEKGVKQDADTEPAPKRTLLQRVLAFFGVSE